MKCPACPSGYFAILAPLFALRPRRWFDFFLQPRENRFVPGMTRIPAGYECVCARCGHRFCRTRRGVFQPFGTPAAERRTPRPQKPDEPKPTPDFPTFDHDVMIPGERVKS